MSSYVPRRMLVFDALAFGAGIFVGVRLDSAVLWLGMCALALALSLFLTFRRKTAWPVAALFVFFGGMALSSHAAHPALPPEGLYHVQATVSTEAKIREEDGRVSVYLKNAALTDEAGKRYALNGLYWTYWPETPDEALPQEGQTAAFTAKLYHPQGRTNPYGFDFKLYLLQRKVQAGVSGAQELALSPQGQDGPRSLLLRLRKAILTRLETLLGDTAYLAQALLLGETEGMPEEMREAFRRAGVAHVLSVSGLHAMLIMSLVIALLDYFAPSPRLMLVVVGVLLVFYCVLTGGSAPIIRAAVLVIYQLGARCTRRTEDPLTALAAGFWTILIFRPLELFSAGFQMSFGAVLGMIMLGDRLDTWIRRIPNGFLRSLCTAYSVTLCATLGTALPTVYTYNSLSLIGLIINPVICILLEVLLPAVAVLLLLSLISVPLAAGVGGIVAYLSHLSLQGVQKISEIPYAVVQLPDPPWYLALAVVCCLLLCTRYVDMTVKNRLTTGGAALALSCLVMFLSAGGDVRYIQFDDGEADAAVVEDGRQTIVIDVGEYGGDLSSYLLSVGRKVDHLILTHLHADHALGLKQLLADEVQIGAVYISTEAMVPQISSQVLEVLGETAQKGVPIYTLSAGETLKTQRVQIDVLWPVKDTAHAVADANDSAMALYIDLDGMTLMHMSDLSGVYELYAAREAELLKVAHHGSASSTGEALLARVNPAVALISGGSPHEKTLERLANAGAMVYDTGTYGALTVTVRGDTYTMDGYVR